MLVTVSASYGAGGSVVAPGVAERLGVAFLDRVAASVTPSEEPHVVGEMASDGEDLSKSLWQRIIDSFAAAPPDVAEVAPLAWTDPAQRARERAEARLMEFAQAGGGVVLGWAGAAVLPQAFRVRLDGPVEARVRQGMAIEGVDEATARARLKRSDDIRRVYWRRLYRRDWRDPDLYHLWVDSTAVDLDTTVQLVVLAARAHAEAG
jgi:cytidylate kinase